MIILTGISNTALKNLRDHRLQTIEIRSPHNFLSVLKAEVGDPVFLTSSSLDDLRPGITGLVAIIRAKQVAMHRVLEKTAEFYEERELSMARLQLEVTNAGRIRRVDCCTLGEPARVEADEITVFEAR